MGKNIDFIQSSFASNESLTETKTIGKNIIYSSFTQVELRTNDLRCSKGGIHQEMPKVLKALLK